MRLSVGYVDKVVKFNEDTNSSLASPRNTPVRNKIPAAVVEYLETEKLSKPTVYTSELQQRFLLDGFSPPGHFPSQLAIKKCIREDCKMTRKKISQVLKESLSQVNTDYTNYFLNQIGQSDPTEPRQAVGVIHGVWPALAASHSGRKIFRALVFGNAELLREP